MYFCIRLVAPHGCWYTSVTDKQHLLAVGDNSGTLHILEIPWSLRQPTPNELQGVANYFDREVKRRGFVVERWNFREKEKMEIESENKRKAGVSSGFFKCYRSFDKEYDQHLTNNGLDSRDKITILLSSPC